MSEPRLIVIGIGNTLMGDDGFGPVVARRLADVLPPDVLVVEGHLAGMGLSKHFMAGVPVIVIDALSVDAEAGAIFRFDPDDAGITSLRSNTSHGHGLPHLITNARLAGCDPQVLVYAAQVGDVRPNPDTLSPEVTVAADRVVELIAEDISGRLAEAAAS